MNRVFDITIIQPAFDELYRKYETSFSSQASESQLLQELRKVQGLVEEADRGGRKNGDVMTKVLNQALPLVKRVDDGLYNELKQNVAAFQYYYTVDMTYEIGNTFLPYLRRSVNIIDQAVKHLEAEEKFPEDKIVKRPKKESLGPVSPVQITDSQVHLGIGDNVGENKIEEKIIPPTSSAWHTTWWGRILIGVVIGLVVFTITLIVGN